MSKSWTHGACHGETMLICFFSVDLFRQHNSSNAYILTQSKLQDEEAGEGGWFWNEQVASFRPPGALYCRECGVLVQDYDHLCPWTGTGIGRDK
jgi:DHHC palmitoyltransferase